MSYFTAWIASLILIGSVWSQVRYLPQQDGYPSPRFGFGFLEPLRKKYCTDYCKSADSVYITNLACAIKCPELYLPYLTTTTSLPTNVNITNSSSLMGPQNLQESVRQLDISPYGHGKAICNKTNSAIRMHASFEAVCVGE
ncbi:PREDICTED: uncharacterized protein LOC107187966 [Dufourea novaeangliae]|uniref:uncharacterized protein LOC107187966 n=1 Tax=Dufourea novaeangliae TaxID=178035 RepID=UPI000767C1F9|nr:PREDICTED: uncharacterized protein LOC107187966 [Dufourea novaeangliae]